MKPMSRYAVLILMLLLCLSTASLAAVQVSWIDAAGSHVVDLALQSNPEYTSDPWTIEKLLSWQADIYVIMTDDFPLIDFTISGNFFGGGPYNLDVWDQVRLNQHVLNSTSSAWKEFIIECADLTPDPNPALFSYATFYNQNYWSPSDWWVDQEEQLTRYYRAEEGSPYVTVGSEFVDVCKLYADVNDDGDGGAILTKYAVPVPEPGSLVALAMGITGLMVLKKRH